MEQKPKIAMKNLYWMYSDRTGVIPYIFNKQQTAIRLYSEFYDYRVLQLSDDKHWSSNQKAIDACNEYLGEQFKAVPAVDVYENGFSTATQIIKFIMAGSELDNIQFSQKDIDTMQRRYNKHIYEQHRLQEKLDKEQRSRQATQDAIMDF